MARLETHSGSFDAYVVLCPFRELCAEFKIIIGPLAAYEAEQLSGADGYYCDEIDSAILVLRFRREFVDTLGPNRVLELVASWGRPVVAPERMSDVERDRFFLDHLARYTTYVQQYPSADESEPMLLRVLDHLSEHVNAPQPQSAAEPWAAPARKHRRPTTKEWSF